MQLRTATALAAFAAVTAGTASADHIWINEFHYDNASTDVNEQVEVVIRTPNGSGETASSYALEFYNGSNGDLYNTTGTLDTFDVINSISAGGSTFTFYTIQLPSNGLQNGPDAIALVDVVNSTLVSFLSYEGSFTADADNGGIAGAAGATATDVGVFETGSTGTTESLGLTGTGDSADDFTWGFGLTQTPGAANTGQTFVPEPGSLALLGLGGLMIARRRRA